MTDSFPAPLTFYSVISYTPSLSFCLPVTQQSFPCSLVSFLTFTQESAVQNIPLSLCFSLELTVWWACLVQSSLLNAFGLQLKMTNLSNLDHNAHTFSSDSLIEHVSQVPSFPLLREDLTFWPFGITCDLKTFLILQAFGWRRAQVKCSQIRSWDPAESGQSCLC